MMERRTRREIRKMVEHYYSKEQKSQFRPRKITIRVSGIELEVYTAAGVFSPKKLDAGTRLLIEKGFVRKGRQGHQGQKAWRVLDFGCGYGVLGILLKQKNPSIDVVMSDVNARAVKLANMNIKLNNVKADVMQSDVFANKRLDAMRFDAIFLNPPQTAGKKICFRMIEEAKDHLVKGGLLQLVARHQKGGKHLSQKMEEVFGNVRDIAKKSGYRVYVSEKK